jgi:hypothetical protein
VEACGGLLLFEALTVYKIIYSYLKPSSNTIAIRPQITIERAHIQRTRLLFIVTGPMGQRLT